MNVRTLFLTLFLTMYFSVSAQDSYQESIAEYLTVNGTTQKYEGEYKKMVALLKKHFSKSDISEATWTSLQSDKSESLMDIQRKLAVTYKNHFSERDIKKMVAFYKTDAGKQLAMNPAQITSEQNQVIIDYNESSIGKKIAKKEQDLTKDISVISSNWSRDLYMQKVNALKVKGFVPNYEMKATLVEFGKNKHP